MTEQFLLTDAAAGVCRDQFSIGSHSGRKLTGADKWSISKYTLCGGVSEGVDVVELDNGRFRVAVLPTRGMGLWFGECDGVKLGWDSPVARPVHPRHVPLAEFGGLGWLAGFNEWLCRCGLSWMGPPCEDGGIPRTLHGRIANIPAHRVSVEVDPEDPGSISVTGEVDETVMFLSNLRLRSTVRTQSGSNRITIIDEITNSGSRDAELHLLYHTNVGPPLLEAGSTFSAPVKELAPRDDAAITGVENWPTFAPPESGFAEEVYYMRLHGDEVGQSQVLLKNAAGDRGLSLRFRLDQTPCFVIWKNTQAVEDGCVAGLEPATSWPNIRPYEREHGRLKTISPGESYRIELEYAALTSAEEVRAAQRAIDEIQAGREPVIHRSPQPEFSPV